MLYDLAEHIEPNPITFCKLASINRSFYTVFTSDKIWRPLDVYHQKTNIYKHFIDSKPGALLSLCWQHTDLVFIPDNPNRYIQLGYYLHNASTLEAPDMDLLEMAIDIRPQILRDYAKVRPITSEIALRACAREMACFQYTNGNLNWDTDLCRSLIDLYNPLTWSSPPLLWFDPSIYDQDMVKYAMKTDPGIIVDIKRLYDQLSDLPFDLSLLLDQVESDRTSLLAAVRGRATALEVWPHHATDKQVYLEALSIPQVTGYSAGYLPGLDTSEDLDIILAAVTLDPRWLLDIPKHWGNNPIVAKAVLKRDETIDTEILDAIHKDLLHDPEILGLMLDKHIQHEITKKKVRKLTNPVAYIIDGFAYPSELLAKLCDNEKWMKARIIANSIAWKLVSDRLKQEKNLLVCAIKSAQVDGTLFLDSVPHQDSEILQLAATIGYLDENSDKILDRKIVIQTVSEYGLERYPQYLHDIELVCQVLSDQPNKLKNIDPGLLESPEFKEYVNDHKYELYELWNIHSTRGIAKKRLGPGPDWNNLDRSRALELIKKKPVVLTKFPGYILDPEFAIEAVLICPEVFEYLPLRLKNHSSVRDALLETITY